MKDEMCLLEVTKCSTAEGREGERKRGGGRGVPFSTSFLLGLSDWEEREWRRESKGGKR